jgi:hypothetical protein
MAGTGWIFAGQPDRRCNTPVKSKKKRVTGTETGMAVRIPVFPVIIGNN